MSEEIRISEFNELQFKMMRVHTLQHQINELWINPLSPNLTFGDYNFNLIISNLESLYAEVYAKCSNDEIETTDKLFANIERKIHETPPYESNCHPTSKKTSLNKESWFSIKNDIRKLNFHIRKLLDNHGFSPDKDDDDTLGL